MGKELGNKIGVPHNPIGPDVRSKGDIKSVKEPQAGHRGTKAPKGAMDVANRTRPKR